MSTHTNTKKTNVVLVASLAVFVAFSAAGRVAHADERDGDRGFIELAIGQATPTGDDKWDDNFDATSKLGLRGGYWARHGLGLELALDYTPLDSFDYDLGLATGHADWTRLRLLIGGRGGAQLTHSLVAFGRVLVGIDYIGESGTATFLGNTGSHDESDTGFAAEIGGGVALNVFRTFSVGAQIAIPMAFHRTDSDLQDNRIFGYRYDAYDVDLMLTVGSAF